MILVGHIAVGVLLLLVLTLSVAVLKRRLADRPSDGEVWHEMWTPRGRRWHR